MRLLADQLLRNDDFSEERTFATFHPFNQTVPNRLVDDPFSALFITDLGGIRKITSGGHAGGRAFDRHYFA